MISLLKKTDAYLWGSLGILISAGLLTLASSAPDLFFRQVIHILIGIILALLLIKIDLRPLITYKWFIVSLFLMSVFWLILVPIIGTEVGGNKSWIDFGFFRFQPSEFAKITLIIILAAFFSKKHVEIGRFGTIASSFLYFIIPAILILLEPDLGSALIFFGIWFGFLLVAGLPFRYLLSAVVVFLAMTLLAWNFALKDYQKDRVLAIFNPESDPLGVNYNVIQSKNAIGSAGIFGKGFGQGAIVQLGFLPAAQTDFIFSSFTEEWGLLGASIVIFAFCVLVWRICKIGITANRNFYKFICLGGALFFTLHFAVNIGSALGFLPVIGIVLPFLSYGGSSILISFSLIGIIQNIAARSVS